MHTLSFKYSTAPECPKDWHVFAEEYNITDYKLVMVPYDDICPGMKLPVVHFNDNRTLETLRNLPDPGDCHRLQDNLQPFNKNLK